MVRFELLAEDESSLTIASIFPVASMPRFVRYAHPSGIDAEQASRFVRLEPNAENLRLSIDLTAIGRRRKQRLKDRDTEIARDLLRAATRLAESTGSEKEFSVRMGDSTHRKPSGRLPMLVGFTWPQLDANVTGVLGTTYMQTAASALNYPNGKMSGYEGVVYADVDRERGVTLQTEPMLGCSLDTDGSTYDPDDERVLVTALNIYSPEQQILCFVGGAALAYADELVAA